MHLARRISKVSSVLAIGGLLAFTTSSLYLSWRHAFDSIRLESTDRPAQLQSRSTINAAITNVGLQPVARRAVVHRPQLQLAAVAEKKPAVHEPLPEPRLARRPTAESLATPVDSVIEPTVPPRRPAPPTAVTTHRCWAFPRALADDLAGIAEHHELQPWAADTLVVLGRLVQLETLDAPDTDAVLRDLGKSITACDRFIHRLPTGQRRTDLARVRYGLARRLDIWQYVAHAARKATAQPHPKGNWKLTPDELTRMITAAENELDSLDEADAWRTYLQLGALRSVGPSEQAVKNALRRLDGRHLSEQQREFLKASPFRNLSARLRAGIESPIDLSHLLADMELYELSVSAEGAARFVRHIDNLRWSSSPVHVGLGEAIERHYRNANARIEVSREMLQRTLPSGRQDIDSISNVVGSTHIAGQAETNSDVEVTLVPDARRWRVLLTARGDVVSETQANNRAFTYFGQGNTEFQARKYLTFNGSRLHVGPTLAAADSNTALVGVRTKFDAIPLIGSMAQRMALNSYHRRAGEAECVVEGLVSSRVETRFDQRVQKRIDVLAGSFRKNLLDPVRQLDLRPETMQLETTPYEMIGRFRVAEPLQLAAHTPRPAPPRGARLSLQLHESALNNWFEQLHLSGRTVDAVALRDKIAGLFSITPAPNDRLENITLSFAEGNPVRVRCDEGRVKLTIDLAGMTRGSRRWPPFEVTAWYRPGASNVKAVLVRDGVVQLRGERLGIRDRIPLSGIFGRLFSREREIGIINAALQPAPEFRGLAVSQYVIDDGWIGITMGMERHPPVGRVAETPESSTDR